MKLLADIFGETYQIETRREATTLFASIADRQYQVESSEPEPNVFLLKHGGKLYEAFVSPRNGAVDPFVVHINGRDIEISLSDPKRLRGFAANAEHEGGPAEIKTAMPGKVVRILVAAGDAVKKGDGVIVVEAMKMQNEMRSPKDGTVVDIRFAEGATVAAGDILATID